MPYDGYDSDRSGGGVPDYADRGFLTTTEKGNYGDRPCKVSVFCGAGVWGQTLRDSAHDASLR